MNQEKSQIKSFMDLNAWKEEHKLVLIIYKICKCFPKDEQYALINQMRRAVVSVTSNIAEGFSRKSYKEKIQFYYLAQGSLTELQNQLIIAKDVKYVNKKRFENIFSHTITVHKILTGLIKTSKKYIK